MESPSSHELKVQVRSMQVIILALSMGIIFFAAIDLFLVGTDGPAVEANGEVVDQAVEQVATMPMVSYMGVAFAAIGIVMSSVVPSFIASRSPGTVQVYQTTLIIGAALLEGPAFLNLIAYMLEHQIYSFATAAVLLVFLLLKFPTIARVEDWLRDRAQSDREAEMFNR